VGAFEKESLWKRILVITIYLSPQDQTNFLIIFINCDYDVEKKSSEKTEIQKDTFSFHLE